MKNEEKEQKIDEMPILSGKEAKFIRKEAGISAEYFADKMGRTKNFVYYYENFKSVPLWFTNKLMKLIEKPLFNLAREQFACNPEKISKENTRKSE